MKRTLFIILSVVAVFMLIGIAVARLTGPRTGNTFSTISNALPGDGYGGGNGGGAPERRAMELPAPALDSAANGVTYSEKSAEAPAQAQERLVIESADLAIVVKDPRASMQAITALAKEFGGFVVSSNISQISGQSGKEVPEANIIIRVSSDKLDEALDKIKAGAIEIQSENRSGQDVTSQYVDLQAQLKAKQAAEQKLLEIMDKAVRAEDVLNTYLQVQNVQTEIEQLKGQIKYLEESANLSAVSIRLIAEAGTQPIAVGAWKPSGTAKEAIQDLIVFFQNFVNFLIFFVLNILPKMILIAIPLYLVYLAGRAIYRRMVKSEKAVEQTKG